MTEESEVSRYAALPYAVEVVPDICTDETLCYVASNPELPGCVSHGATPEEAIGRLKEVRKTYLETLLSRGLKVPLPRASTGSAATGCAPSVVWTVVATMPQTLTCAFKIRSAASIAGQRTTARETRVTFQETICSLTQTRV